MTTGEVIRQNIETLHFLLRNAPENPEFLRKALAAARARRDAHLKERTQQEWDAR